MEADDDKGPPSSSFVKKGDRQLFTVELRPNETTVVSWKKLMKDANNQLSNNGSTSNVNPNLDSTLLPQQTSIPEQPTRQTNRLGAVMEKIERLYMGKDSSDEEDQLDILDDQYDTQDSFIDDAELDDYFEVDNLAIQNDGFFINRGELKIINTPPMLPSQLAKKRHQKDILKNPSENFDGNVSRKNAKVEKFGDGKIEYLPVKSEDVHSQMLKNPPDACVSNRTAKVGKSAIEKNSFLLVKSEVDDHVSDVNVKVDKSTAENVAFLPVKSEDVDDHMLKTHGKNVDGHISCKHIKVSQSTTGKTTFLPVKSEVDSSHKLTIPSENYEDLKSQSQFVVPGRTRSSTGNLEKFEKHAQKSKKLLKKGGSSSVMLNTMLEKAIRDLEKTVAELRPPIMENQEFDTTTQAIKQRLPREIMLKLAKVARLEHANKGEVSNELIIRLMSILGHLIQLRTLKRRLKIMINMGLSAKQEKDDRFQQIKKEIIKMIKLQAPSMETMQMQQVGASAEQQSGPDGKATTKGNFCMDPTLEDKICDIYDIFVEGLEEFSVPQIRKLYVELAQLWPNGCMDNHGVKNAICRAKQRRRELCSKQTDQEQMKGKMLLTTQQEGNAPISTASRHKMREQLAPESSSSHTSWNKAVSNTVIALEAVHPSLNAQKQEKAKGSSSCSQDDVWIIDNNGVLIKKKAKRKLEYDHDITSFCPKKLASLKGEEKPRSLE